MKSRLFILSSLFALLLASFAMRATDTEPAGITFPKHSELDLKSLPLTAQQYLKGMTRGLHRKGLETHFGRDGGLIPIGIERYFLHTPAPGHPGDVVMVDVAFRPAGMDEATFADPKRRAEWMDKHPWEPKPDDIVEAFSKPYASGIHFD